MTLRVDPPSATIYRFPVPEKSAAIPASATEESGSITFTGTGVAETKEAPRAFLQVGRRNLREDEISTPAVGRFLIAEIERLDLQCDEHKRYVGMYHDQRVTIATLTETGKISRWREALSITCISVGFAGLGAAPNYLAIAGAERFVWIVIGLSLVLVSIGLLSRVFK
ncbi:MAG: hypothetical protein ABSE22_17450 [Xanthobacteraceae bacterium]|jgi:hypothetical protein